MTNRFVVLDEGPGFDCHSERQEESGVGFTRIKKQILRVAQDDKLFCRPEQMIWI